MNPNSTAVEVIAYLGPALLVIFMGSVYSGWKNKSFDEFTEDSLATLIGLGFIWPIILFIGAIIGIFWLPHKIGELARTLVEKYKYKESKF